MIAKNYLPISLTLCALLFSACRKAASIGNLLGPSDAPTFKTFDWESGDISYKLRSSSGKLLEESFTISRTELKNWFSLLEVSSVRGLSIGVTPEMRLKTKSGEYWSFYIVFENDFVFTDAGDKSRVYSVKTSDSPFYMWIKNRCLEDALLKYPSVIEKI